jgi:hypothetical protein
MKRENANKDQHDNSKEVNQEEDNEKKFRGLRHKDSQYEKSTLINCWEVCFRTTIRKKTITKKKQTKHPTEKLLYSQRPKDQQRTKSTNKNQHPIPKNDVKIIA